MLLHSGMPTKPRRAWTTLIAVALALTWLAVPPAAAVSTNVGFQGASYSGVTAPTAEKPESKLWFHDGRWWASMYAPRTGDWHIFYLNRSATPKAWVDTGTVIDTRADTLSDTLAADGKLYVASHVRAPSNTSIASGRPARLYRYSYHSATRRYSLDPGFPTAINNVSSETLTLDRDATGRLWATWTQDRRVYVSTASASGQWGTPFVLPAGNATGISSDDISSVVSFAGRVGVLWTSQSRSAAYFSYHLNGNPVGTWSATEQVTVPGFGHADDHLNIKQVRADGGRVVAVLKTSLDNAGSSAPLIVVVSRTSTGGWDRATFGTVGDCHTRPTVMLDSANDRVHVFATAPPSGCSHGGAAGAIFEKTSPMSRLSFAPGRGTPVMHDLASPHLNNVTSSKGPVNAETGIVLLASNDATHRYWFSDRAIAAPVQRPVAGFSASPTAGTAPLAVQFRDTSTGSPTSWHWSFGDGSTSTAQHPAHRYRDEGSYTVSLTVRNSAGSDTVVRTRIVRAAAAPAPRIRAVSSSTRHASTATRTVRLARPSGTRARDVLVASFTADRNPSVRSIPPGWRRMVDRLSVKSSATSGARVFAYYRVVSSREPARYTWRLNSSQRWGGGVTAYRGVDTRRPLDTGVARKATTTWSATSLKIRAITTRTPHALLISGVGVDSSSRLVKAPAGWSYRWQARGGQIAAQADRTQVSAGRTSTMTWRLTAGRAFAGWRTALRPAR